MNTPFEETIIGDETQAEGTPKVLADAAESENGRRGWRVWSLSAVIAVAAATIAAALRDATSIDAPLHIPWWALAAGFFAAEVAVVHVRFRADAHSFSMSEIPFVLGLFFVSPVAFVTAQLVGTGAALALHRRQPAVKLFFNLGQFALQAVVGLLVFRALVGADPLGAAGIAGALAATLAALVVGDTLVNVAIRLSGGEIGFPAMLRVFSLSAVAVGLNTGLALSAVVILWSRPGLAWLALAPAVALFLGYRSLAAQRAGRVRRTVMTDVTRGLEHSPDLEQAFALTASRSRDLFEAEFTEIYVFPTGAEGAAYRTAVGPGNRREEMWPVEMNRGVGVWDSAIDGGGACLVDLEQTPVVVETGSPVRDAIAAPLQGSDGPCGAIIVGNRLGDLGSFGRDDVAVLDGLASQLSLLIASRSGVAMAPRRP